MAVLGYLAKLKESLGLAFGAHFVHDFSMKVFCMYTLSMDKVLMSHLISSSRYQTKCVIKFLSGQLTMSLTLRFFLNQTLEQWMTGKKRGEDENAII